MKYFKYTLILLIAAIMAPFEGCIPPDEELTNAEIIEGLKTALEIGTDSSCTLLHFADGYYGNEIVKILLPPEAEPVYDIIEAVPAYIGDPLEDEIEKVVLGINRAAEDAADDAKPIFIDAITSMTIEDGLNILKGIGPAKDGEFDSLAATHYLEYKTRDALILTFSPKIDESLDKDLGLGFSANEAWDAFKIAYNFAAIIAGFEEIDEEASIGEFAVGKALDGLFHFIGEEEKKIRKDPYQWAIDIIRKVFGWDF